MSSVAALVPSSLASPAEPFKDGLMVSVFLAPLAARAISPRKGRALGIQQNRLSYPGRENGKGLYAAFFSQLSRVPCFADGCREQDNPVGIQASELKTVVFVPDFMRNKSFDKRKVLNPKEKVQ
jgi:hypothetical protein